MRPLTIVLLVVLAGTLFVAWFFTVHEKVETDVYVGFQGEARFNDHYAATMLLEELGTEVETRSSLTPTEWLPDPSDTLFTRLAQPMTIGEQRGELLRWVSDGGHLVLLPPRELGEDVESFLREFELELVEPEYVYDEDADAESRPTEINDDDDEYALAGYFNEAYIELANSSTEANVVVSRGKIIIARREYGTGFLTLLADGNYFTNHYLNEQDNARLFADVMVGELESGKVWIVYRTVFAPLWRVIWDAAPFFVSGLAILLVLWIWHAMPGFGPRIRTEGMERRSIIEHIRASGMFVWRKQGADNLYDSSTQALLHDADAKHPGLKRQSAEKQAESISRITGMPAAKVMGALAGLSDGRQRDFTNSMQKLQTIRKEL